MTYLRERNHDNRSWGAGMTPKNSHESIIVSMSFNAQPARSIDRDILCMSFINIWLKMPNLRYSSLCLSGGDEIH